MAAGAALGGLDRIFGNRLALGRKFEEGFNLLGPLALSMAGVICLMPLLGGLLERVIAPHTVSSWRGAPPSTGSSLSPTAP